MYIKKINSVSFQGIEGANSHLASKALFPKAKIITCETFEEVFDSVKNGKSNIGLIPVENSVAGRVAEIHSLMHKTTLKIIGEYFMQVELHLLGLKNANIKTYYCTPMYTWSSSSWNLCFYRCLCSTILICNFI